MSKRQEKKSESIEIRLPYSQKTAFIDACREQGISASEALRTQIDFFMTQSEKPRQHDFIGAFNNMLERHKKKTFAGVATFATAMSLAFALPSSADNTQFKSFDRNGDGVLTAGEISANDSKIFAILDKDKSGKITPEEFQKTAEIVSITDTMVPAKETGKPDVRVLEIDRTSFELNGPDDVSIYVQNWAEEIDPKAKDADVKNILERMKLELKDVQTAEKLEKLDPETRVKVFVERKHEEEIQRLVKLKQLEKLENLKIDLDLDELTKLENFDFEFDFDFSDMPDFSELEKELAELQKNTALKLSENDMASIAKARAELSKARAEMAKLAELKHVFVVRKDLADGKENVVVKTKVIKKETKEKTTQE